LKRYFLYDCIQVQEIIFIRKCRFFHGGEEERRREERGGRRKGEEKYQSTVSEELQISVTAIIKLQVTIPMVRLEWE
jgi:hypothetical protein